jgi:hypothetical protein
VIEETYPVNAASVSGSNYTQISSGLIAKQIDHNPTVGENLDRRIAHLEHELAEAKASREALAPLLNIKIRDIRRAMDY